MPVRIYNQSGKTVTGGNFREGIRQGMITTGLNAAAWHTVASLKGELPRYSGKRHLRRRRHPQLGVQHQAQLVLQQPADAQQAGTKMPHRRQIVVAGPALPGAEEIFLRQGGKPPAYRRIQGPHEIPPGRDLPAAG